ncbi:hypothetical protein [Kibdelosporangium aridum]|uniref:hypothetical protein n=1 Tax=Kibdelosporangium aridum TaxID=2030 RepID=UPI000A5F9E28|nr:hypothetical protein [Kibdelosporangium aridum]
MVIPDIDAITAESMLQDADFAEEHKRPTFADEPSTERPDESVPSGHGGMDLNERRYLL